MYREYELRGDTLIVYICDKHRFLSGKFSLVIRVNVINLSVSIEALTYCGRSFIEYELKRVYDLLDFPHWRSFVASCGHHDVDNELFVP